MHFNSYWYLGLGILSLLLLGYVCLKKRNKRSLMLFFFMIGLGYFIEAIIYIFLGSYQYFPKFLADEPYYDSNMGAIASNALALPSAAAFIAVFRLRWIWLFVFTGLFVGIELLFLYLHIYSHNWWRLSYTALGLPVFFATAKMLHLKLLQPLKGAIHFMILMFIIGPITGTLHILPIMLLNNRYYRPGWFVNLAHDTTAFSAVYYMCLSLLLVITVNLHWKYKWLKYVFVSAFAALVTITLNAVGLLYSLVWWDPIYYIVMPMVILKIAMEVSKRLSIGPVLRKE
ncbi:hypothetical protein [Paenibacillus sp. PL91]|uniref:hypothetical protein n=1 Tax=Paenibacillus sp. PL91 TaxID=2729538 RepID=UPI00145C827D|nr:hypothetical protein [Paenibacillus sp. PL91]MBC9204689.1 hypothetical protein [Paenibacillus sp. PL91]